MSENSISYVRPQALRTAEPFSTLFPVKMATLSAVSESMESTGFDAAEPIVAWDGLIIDGHTRLGAALAAGIDLVPVVDRAFESEDEALEYAIKRQRDRRNLTDADLLHCLQVLDSRKNKAANLKVGPEASPEASAIQGTYGAIPGKSAAATAEILGTSRAKVEKGRAVLDHAPEEVKAQVESGEKSINAAYNETRPTAPHRPRPTPGPHPLPHRPPPGTQSELDQLRLILNEREAQLEECRAQLQETTKLLQDTEEENKSFARVLEADDQVKAALAEAKRFRELARVTQERNNGLMNHGHALAKDARRWMNKFLRLERSMKGLPPDAELPPEPEDEPPPPAELTPGPLFSEPDPFVA